MQRPPLLSLPEPHKPLNVVNGYALVARLGSRPNPRMHLGVRSPREPPVAVKAVRVGVEWSGLAIQREIRLHRWADHPHLVKLHRVFHAPRTQTAYLFFE
jgi:serine/threonine protein kinase